MNEPSLCVVVWRNANGTPLSSPDIQAEETAAAKQFIKTII
jgi:hypothetical protein